MKILCVLQKNNRLMTEHGERRNNVPKRKNPNSMKTIERVMNNNVSWNHRQSNKHKLRNDKIGLRREDNVIPDLNACCRNLRSNKMKCSN